MKNASAFPLILITLALSGVLACNQNTPAAGGPPKPKEVTEEEFNKMDKKVAKPNSDQTNAPLMENMQGKWKSMAEKGVTYEVKGDQIIRSENDKAGASDDITFATDCGINCGPITKKIGQAGHVGCMTIHGKTLECLWVVTFSRDQVSLFRMGGTSQEVEIWVRM